MSPDAQAELLLLEHMLECIERIRSYTGGKRDTFFDSRLVQDAVLRNLQLMTESSQRLADVAKAAEPAIPWQNIAGMRNILVHQYLGGIDLEIVWQAIENDLDPLVEALQRMRGRALADPQGRSEQIPE